MYSNFDRKKLSWTPQATLQQYLTPVSVTMHSTTCSTHLNKNVAVQYHEILYHLRGDLDLTLPQL